MSKERFKSVILTLLVISSIILTVNKWFSEKLWPDGYNFFSNLSGYFQINNKTEKKKYYFSKENISNPYKIVVNNGDMRSVYTHTSENYNTLLPGVKRILISGLGESEFSAGSDEKWKAALKESSIYISYPVSYNTSMFSAIMGTGITDFGINSMSEFIIAAGDKITGKPRLYIRDSSAGKIVDVALKADPVKLDELIASFAQSSSSELPYSFELNFDKSTDSIEQRIIIDPQVILSISPVSQPSVTRINYFENISTDKAMYAKILRAFGYNTTNIRKYVNVDNSVVFAENYGTIRMYDDGYLEYKALDDTKGIQLGDSSSTSYDIFTECIEFINKVWDTACGECNMDINISSFTPDSDKGSFRLTLDYYADGMRVVSNLAKTDTHDKMGSAIEITVKNSRIVSYKQIVYGFVSNGDSISCESVIDALDVLTASESIKSDTITDLYLAYNAASKKDTCYARWVAKTAKNETRVITP